MRDLRSFRSKIELSGDFELLGERPVRSNPHSRGDSLMPTVDVMYLNHFLAKTPTW